MSAIRKWLASKVFSSVLSNGDNPINESNSNESVSLFGSSSNVESILRNATASTSHDFSSSSGSAEVNNENQSYFSIIYHHYRPKVSQNAPTNEKILMNNMYKFYYANEDLSLISSELDAFDGCKDTDRCSALVNSLKVAQDRVITQIFRIMDEIGCERASRQYRLKFPDELLTGEGIESLNSQVWFGAECLTAGSTLTNNHDKSNYLRPIANNLTTTLDQIRYELRSCCNYLPIYFKIPKDLIKKLEIFDHLFSSFEYDYVKTMLQIKTCEDIENLQELTFLFSDTLSYALKKGLISKEDVDGCQPSVMIALPRLSIVRGLLQGLGSVVCKENPDELTSILRPYHSLLLQFHEFLLNLNEDEIFFLEKLLSTNYDNIDLFDNNSNLPMMDVTTNDDSLLTVFYKFFKHARRMKDNCRNLTFKKSNQEKSITNRYISASVPFLLLNNRNETNNEESMINNNNNYNTSNNIRYSPFKLNDVIYRYNSLPNINFYSTKNSKTLNNYGAQPFNTNGSQNSSSYYSTSNSMSSTSPSLSLTCSSSISVELDFLKQFKDILKRNQLKTKNRNCSSGFYNTNEYSSSDGMNRRRAKTAFTDLNVDIVNEFKSISAFTPTTTSNNSIHFDLAFYTDDLSELTVYTKRILHQVFVMISRIADEFQTNYASELRNILRTVFMLQDIEEERKNNLTKPVELDQFEMENGEHLGKIEEAIDANEHFSQENFSLEHTSQDICRNNSNTCDNNSNMNNINELCHASSLNNVNHCENTQVPSNSCGISSSYPSTKGSVASVNNSNISTGTNLQPKNEQLRQSNTSICSSNSSNSCRSFEQHSQVTSSSATTIDDANRAEMPPFIFSNRTSSPTSSPMIPILGNVTGPSSSSTNLLLPPIWMPDDWVTTCKACTQAFNIIRRRHHCRRCGLIFCHQCSNNFVALKCFGYAKPVRVCNTCLLLHKQSERTEPQISNTSAS